MELLSVLVSAACSGVPATFCDVQAKTGLDARLLYAICFVETRANPKAIAHHDGDGTTSYGICQIKMRTARYVGFEGTAEELMQPDTNAFYAAKYLAKHLRRYQDVHKAVSAYNAGRPITANKKYVSRVMGNYTVLNRGGDL